MSRTIGNTFGTQLTSGSLRPFYAIKMKFTSGELRITTTYSNLVIDNESYIGTGDIINISPITETSDTRATGVEIILNGLDTAILSAGLTEDTQGMVVEIYFGVLDTVDNADAIVDTPYQIFSGFIDAMILKENGESSSLTFTIENKLVTLEKAIDRRYTDQDQKNLFAGDRGLEFVASLQDKTISWGGGTN